TSDENKGITSITYNHLNLPLTITFHNDTGRMIHYLYDAVGMKVRKVIKEPTKADVVIDYLGGFQYSNGVLLHFPHAEGYVKFTPLTNPVIFPGDDPNPGTFNYVFNYLDHLGNI